RSTLTIDLFVGPQAVLHWAPQPMVSIVGSDHRTVVNLSATSSSTVTMSEGVSLGRHGELSGRLALRQRVTIDHEAVLDNETVFAPGPLLGPGAHGSGRAITSTVTIGGDVPAPMSEVTATCARATFHISPTCALAISTR
ncbi:MAG: ureD, partial [Ilumatobacteraceae bacterium]|nr:ureD [Ilumatobacteraceae bacterium]